MRLGRASVERGCRLGLASSFLSTLAILMSEKNKMKVGRCDASEHACVTLSKFRLISGNVSLYGRTFVSQIRSTESSAGTLSGGGNKIAAGYFFVASIPSIAKENEFPTLIIKRIMQSMTGEYGTV